MVISLTVNKSLISPLYSAHVAVRSGVVMTSICSLSCEYRYVEIIVLLQN